MKSHKNYIPYGRQSINKNDIDAVVGALESHYITQGPRIAEFEKELARKVGAKYAVAVNSGTSALHTAYFAAGLNTGENIITSPLTFSATSNAALYLGGNVKFVDIESDTGNIDVTKIEGSIDRKTKIIVPIHFAGHPTDLEQISKIAKRSSLVVVEDATHALGAKYKHSKIGDCKYSDMAVFSFHAVKHITTGEGGAITTNSKALYDKLMVFRTHGITKQNLRRESPGDWYYEMQYLGYNYRITDIQAALGLSQLKKLGSFIKKRREIARAYNRTFAKNKYFDIPTEKDYAYAVYHLYPIRLKDKYISRKSEIFKKLRDMGIGVQTHYIPVHTHPYYRENGYKNVHFPVSEHFYESEISLPIFPTLSKKSLDYVIKVVNDLFSKL